MKLVAFDLGAHFAWATNFRMRGVDSFSGLPGIVLGWGHRHFGGDRQERLGRIMLLCEKLFLDGRRDGLEAVFYERPFARGMAATRSGWGIAGVIEATAREYCLVALDMPPATIKKFATGKGRASKEEMIEAARRFGYTGSDEHEADAVCALKYAEANMVKGNDND